MNAKRLAWQGLSPSIGFWITLIVTSATMAMLIVGHRAASLRPAAARPPGQKSAPAVDNLMPRSFEQLTALDTRELADLDIARVNLLCADGLPGAERMEVDRVCALFDQWADRVRRETARHWAQFERDPGSFRESAAYFRMLALVTVLQQDCGIHYDPERIRRPDHRDAASLFLHGLAGDSRRGTCVSIPVLYVAIGRRLGYPLKLVTTKGHLFARWDAEGERFNLEATGEGLNCFPDAYYEAWPVPLTAEEKSGEAHLRSLDAAGELAVFLSARGHCLEANGRWPEAQLAHALAHVRAPEHPDYLAFLAGAIAREMPAWQQIRVDWGGAPERDGGNPATGP